MDRKILLKDITNVYSGQKRPGTEDSGINSAAKTPKMSQMPIQHGEVHEGEPMDTNLVYSQDANTSPDLLDKAETNSLKLPQAKQSNPALESSNSLKQIHDKSEIVDVKMDASGLFKVPTTTKIPKSRPISDEAREKKNLFTKIQKSKKCLDTKRTYIIERLFKLKMTMQTRTKKPLAVVHSCENEPEYVQNRIRKERVKRKLLVVGKLRRDVLQTAEANLKAAVESIIETKEHVAQLVLDCNKQQWKYLICLYNVVETCFWLHQLDYKIKKEEKRDPSADKGYEDIDNIINDALQLVWDRCKIIENLPATIDEIKKLTIEVREKNRIGLSNYLEEMKSGIFRLKTKNKQLKHMKFTSLMRRFDQK